MKTIKLTILWILSFLIMSSSVAQPPLSFNYQAVVRDDAGMVIASEVVSIEVSIVMGYMDGDAVFSETHQTQTNEFGLVNLQIGSVNTLENIDWGSDDFFIKVSLDGEVMGVTQLLSVPYAFHSHTSADTFSGNYEDLFNIPDLEGFVELSDPESGDIVYFSEDGWASIPAGSQGQVLAMEGGKPQWVDAVFEIVPGTVTDVDGNEYETVLIGDQLWMAENLRTTKYRDGSEIAFGLSDTEWAETEEGAYAVYPHELVEGISSETEMIDMYGKLYNYWTIEDERGLCPEGWRVPTADDYDALDAYITFWGGGKEVDLESKDGSVAGNYIKSCRQANSPLGGDCNTNEHPRWDADITHYGTDEFDFNGIPAGYRDEFGNYSGIGTHAYWWTSTEMSFAMGRWRRLINSGGWVYSGFEYKEEGYSIRCIKEE